MRPLLFAHDALTVLDLLAFLFGSGFGHGHAFFVIRIFFTIYHWHRILHYQLRQLQYRAVILSLAVSQLWRLRKLARFFGLSFLISMFGSPYLIVFLVSPLCTVTVNFLRPCPGSPLRIRRGLFMIDTRLTL